jgi:hypothetical protein
MAQENPALWTVRLNTEGVNGQELNTLFFDVSEIREY